MKFKKDFADETRSGERETNHTSTVEAGCYLASLMAQRSKAHQQLILNDLPYLTLLSTTPMSWFAQARFALVLATINLL